MEMDNLSILPNSSVGTSFEAIDLIAMNDVPLNISTIDPRNFMNNTYKMYIPMIKVSSKNYTDIPL